MIERVAVSGRVAALLGGVVLALLVGCASGPRSGGNGVASGRDGAEVTPPAHIDNTPDAQPRIEGIRASGGTSKPYSVRGQAYEPIVDDRAFRETGLASWYGTKFQAQSTASGEPYDMYAMTAAHKTLPLPSYVRVRNPANGREVIVRINDRGPFHDGRVIDLSYTAALRLDLLRGVAPVEIERITNEQIRTGAWRRSGVVVAGASAIAAPPLNVRAAPSLVVEVAVAKTSPVVATPRSEGVELLPLGAAAPPSPMASIQRADTASTAGFWVQLGAFSQSASAADFQQRAVRQMPTLAGTIQVFNEDTLHRVQAGPFASREAARGAVHQVRGELQISPIVVERR